MTRERRALALAQLVVATIEAEAPGTRTLRRAHLRCAAEQPDEAIARELGVLELVEDARDAHLDELDADEGLAALCVPCTRSWPSPSTCSTESLAPARAAARGFRAGGRCAAAAARPPPR